MKIALVYGIHTSEQALPPFEEIDKNPDVELTLFATKVQSETPLRVHSSFYVEDLSEHHMLWAIPWILQKTRFPKNIPLMPMAKHLRDFDIIYSSENYTWASLISAKVSYKYTIPLVLKCDENIPYPPYQNNPVTKYVKRYTINTAGKILAVSPASKKALILEGCDEKKISIIPNAVNTDMFKPISKKVALEKLELNDDLLNSFNFLFVGRLEYMKGIPWLIEAFLKFIEETSAESRLLLVGKNFLKKEWNKVINSNENIIFLDQLPYRKMPFMHNLADVLVLPSVSTENNQEQFGVALIEAMACGKPTIATNVGGMPYVAKKGKTSIIVPQRDTESLKNAMLELYRNSELYEKYKKNARPHVLENFSHKVVSNLLYDEFLKLV